MRYSSITDKNIEDIAKSVTPEPTPTPLPFSGYLTVGEYIYTGTGEATNNIHIDVGDSYVVYILDIVGVNPSNPNGSSYRSGGFSPYNDTTHRLPCIYNGNATESSITSCGITANDHNDITLTQLYGGTPADNFNLAGVDYTVTYIVNTPIE